MLPDLKPTDIPGYCFLGTVQVDSTANLKIKVEHWEPIVWPLQDLKSSLDVLITYQT